MVADFTAHRVVAQPPLVDLADFVDDPLVFEYQNPPRQADDLRHVRRNQDNRLALFSRQVPDQPMDLRLGADIDPHRRLVDNQYVASGQQPFADADLLLIAAAEVIDRLLKSSSADIHRRDHALRRLSLGPVVDPPAELRGEPLPDGDPEIGLDLGVKEQSLFFAILGHIAHVVFEKTLRHRADPHHGGR